MGGHTHGFRWEARHMERIGNLISEGYTADEISGIMSGEFSYPITTTMIHLVQARYHLRSKFILGESLAQTFKSVNLPEDNYMISCDYHAPYYSHTWVNRMLLIAQKFKIKKHIIVGDLLDFDFAKSHPRTEGESGSSLDKEIDTTDPLFLALDYFDKNYLICGNHETRLGRITDARVQSRHVLAVYGKRIYETKFEFFPQDKAFVGKQWLVVHPKSYSQISGSVSVRLAEKYQRNVLSAHGHFVSLRFDRSGEYQAADIGGMFDQRKVAYTSFITTTHPEWNQGFGMLKDGKFTMFHSQTDFALYLGMNGTGKKAA